MRRLAAALARQATPIMAASIPVGFALPRLADLLKPYVSALALAVMVLAMVRIEPRMLAARARRPWPMLAGVAGVLLLSPAAAALLVHATGLAPAIALGVLLVAAAPPLTSAPAYALLLGLDPVIPFLVAVPATLFAPLTMPLAVGVLGGTAVALDPLQLVARLAIFVGLSVLGGTLIRKALGRGGVEREADTLGAMLALVLFFFGIGLTGGLGAVIAAAPAKAIAVLAGALAMNLALQLAGGALFWGAGRHAAFTAALLASMRNLAMVIAAVAPIVPPDTMLFLVASQLPSFFMPMAMRAAFRRLLA